MPSSRKSPTVTAVNPMSVVDAVLVTTLATTFWAGGRVGMGLGVGSVGGGAMQADPSSFIRVPSWQTHSKEGSVCTCVWGGGIYCT